ncbi:DUF1648 domain-containing protein [Pseudarthrobacter sp. Fe7]|nr:DUF1648 domain-containing protein [Pseudarthrobacter sp. Fe7]
MAALLLTTAVGLVLYPGMPDPVPVHWDGTGQADRFAGKSVPAVFSPLLIGAGVVVCCWLLHWLLPALAARGRQGDPAQAALQARAGRDVLAALAPALAALTCWLCLRGWLELTGAWTLWPPTLLLMMFALCLVLRAVRNVSGPPA